ncbi:MAG: copper chaperone PCu(A)C [Stellaceae bacterium]
MRMLRTLVLVSGFMLTAAVASAQTGQLAVDNAWARATPGKSDIGAAYVTIHSPTDDRLVAASTPVAKKAELHTMEMSGMVMKMRPISSIDIPAGQSVSLAPGGMHIMLMGLKQPLKAGQSFPLTLTFVKAGTRTVNVAVEKVGASGPMPAGTMPMPAAKH